MNRHHARFFNRIVFSVALIGSVFSAAPRAEATPYTAYTGQFQHYTNVATLGNLINGTVDVVGDLMNFVLNYSVVTNDVNQGTIKVQGQFSNVVNQTDSNGIELPAAFNPILESVNIMFTGGVHSGRRYVNFSMPNIAFTRVGNDLRFTVGFQGVNISNHPRGPLSFSATLHGITHQIPTTPTTPVPEPVSAALVLTGIAGSALARRSKLLRAES